jgi:hypothetical protein
MAALKKTASKVAAPKAKTPAKTNTPAKTATSPTDVKKLLQLGVEDQLQINALEGGLASQKALRKYQEDASRLDLQANLKTIDRNALDLYKGVSDNYAGRGMLRSGGYSAADDKAKLAVDEEKSALNRAMEELKRTNELQTNVDQESVNAQVSGIKAGAVAQDVQGDIANIADPTNTIGAKPKPKVTPKPKPKVTPKPKPKPAPQAMLTPEQRKALR